MAPYYGSSLELLYAAEAEEVPTPDAHGSPCETNRALTTLQKSIYEYLEEQLDYEQQVSQSLSICDMAARRRPSISDYGSLMNPGRGGVPQRPVQVMKYINVQLIKLKTFSGPSLEF